MQLTIKSASRLRKRLLHRAARLHSRHVAALSAVVVFIATAIGTAQPSLAEGGGFSRPWAGTWATSPQGPNDFFPPRTFDNVTLRQIVRTSIGGTSLRIRFSNSLGSEALIIDAASVAIHDGGGAVLPETLRELTFGGESFVTIPAGARVLSDPVRLRVDAEEDLAISLYVAEETAALTAHSDADQTSFISTPGDFTAADVLPVGETTTSWFWLTGVDVSTRGRTQVIVAVGDSITDGFGSTVDANARWPDILSRLINDRRRGYGHRHSRRVSVLNAGISGNRVLTSFVGPNLLARLDRDILTQTGVTHVILLEGINDIGIPVIFDPSEEVSAEDIIAGMKQFIARSKARGLKVFGGTLLPYRGAVYFTEDGEAKRQAVNEFIRSGRAFDDYIDFDEALRDPDDPQQLLPEFDSGDKLHPSDAGYQRMGEVAFETLFHWGY